jgi:hypothetical protein
MAKRYISSRYSNFKKSFMFRSSLTIIALIFTSFCYSQVNFGIKAGFNFSNAVYNNSNASPEGRVGFYVGTLVDFSLSEKIHLQPEFLYSSEGIKDGSVVFINLPVPLKWYFYEGIHFHAGPQVGMVIDAEGGTGGLQDYSLSGVGGIGYEAPGGGFTVTARFTHGITSLIDPNFGFDTGMGYNIVGIKAWSRSLQFGVGYNF